MQKRGLLLQRRYYAQLWLYSALPGPPAEELGELIEEHWEGDIVERTYVMYHGTSVPNWRKIESSGWRRSSTGMLGSGVYLSRDFQKTKRYALKDGGHGVILKCHVRVGRVVRINSLWSSKRYDWHLHYDTAWVPSNNRMVGSGRTENCVYDPSRIAVVEVFQAPQDGHVWRSTVTYI